MTPDAACRKIAEDKLNQAIEKGIRQQGLVVNLLNNDFSESYWLPRLVFSISEAIKADLQGDTETTQTADKFLEQELKKLGYKVKDITAETDKGDG